MDIQIGDIIMDKSDNVYYIIKDIETVNGNKKIKFGDINDPLKYTYILSTKAIEREFQKISTPT